MVQSTAWSSSCFCCVCDRPLPPCAPPKRAFESSFPRPPMATGWQSHIPTCSSLLLSPLSLSFHFSHNIYPLTTLRHARPSSTPPRFGPSHHIAPVQRPRGLAKHSIPHPPFLHSTFSSSAPRVPPTFPTTTRSQPPHRPLKPKQLPRRQHLPCNPRLIHWTSVPL